MDAGVAGVVGAAIGGGLATIAAIGTSWFNLRQARLQVLAQQQEADKQRRFESTRERREPRQLAYAQFVETAHHLLLRLREGVHDDDSADRLDALRRLQTTVLLLGPDELTDTCAAVLTASIDAFENRMRSNPEDVLGARAAIGNALAEFIEAAREALEDDGQAVALSSSVNRTTYMAD